MEHDLWFVVTGIVIFVGTLGTSYILNLRQHPNTKHLEDELVRLGLQVAKLQRDIAAAGTEGRPRPREAAPREDAVPRARAEVRMGEVVRIVGGEPKTARQIQLTLGQSREHVARLVKRMAEGGYLERSGTRPFLYVATEKGRGLLG